MKYKALINLAALTLPLSFAFALTPQDVINHDSSLGIRAKQIYQPNSQTDLRIDYQFGNLELRPNETIYLEMNPVMANASLDFIYLTHKQDPNQENECRSTDNWDCSPGYTSVEIFDQNQQDITRGWRFWGGRGSGPFNSKFAEIRSGLGETDNLYEWPRHGHLSVEKNGDQQYSPIRPLIVRVRSVGPDSIILQNVAIKLLPPPPKAIKDYIFSNGFDFGDYATGQGRYYPGNADYGDYGNSLALNRYEQPRHPNLDPSFSDQGELILPLSKGLSLDFVDIACGDMKRVPRGADPENFRGNAAMTVILQTAGGQEFLMNAENIGSNGVMRASPRNIHRSSQDGDSLIIRAPRGEAQIMGIRIGYGQ